MKPVEKTVIIIGAGAAGLAAAVTLKKGDPGLPVIVLEKAARAGKKILASGNGRCNLSNVNAGPKYYNNPPFLEDFFKVYDYAYIEKYYRELGLLTVVRDTEGRAYPASNSASSVMDVYNAAIKKYGIEINYGAEVTDITQNQSGYTVKTADGAEYCCTYVICAAGSPAGATTQGDGVKCQTGLRYNTLLRPPVLNKYAETVPLRPSLCPLPGDTEELKYLENIRVKCKVRGLGHEESGEVQFRKDSLSGIVIFNFAAFLARRCIRSAVLSLDLFPEMQTDELSDFIQCQARNADTALGTLAGVCAKGIAKNIFTRLDIPFQSPAAGMAAKRARETAGTLKDYRFKVYANNDFKEAQAASGGVSLSAVDNTGFFLKRYRGLYVAGEALDIDGVCGGFNLHFAACSGIAAARHILSL